jgi:hypothetical protein
VAQQLGQPAANVVRLRGLLNPNFQLTENGMAGNESLARRAALVNALAHCRDLTQRRRQMVAVEQVSGTN